MPARHQERPQRSRKDWLEQEINFARVSTTTKELECVFLPLHWLHMTSYLKKVCLINRLQNHPLTDPKYAPVGTARMLAKATAALPLFAKAPLDVGTWSDSLRGARAAASPVFQACTPGSATSGTSSTMTPL